ncbi:MAG: cell division protein FtsL [Desulfobacterales bacterium]|nr:cell division protein FtsL [Desulfobacterales bacterium]
MNKKNGIKVKEKKQLGLWIIILLFFITELLFYTWCRVQCVRTGYEIANETRRHQQLEMLQNNLKIEITHLKSPERISKIAEKKLGLVTPTPEQMIVIP